MPYKINRRFERFRKNYHENGKKSSFVYPGQHYAHKKNCMTTKFVLRLKKKEFLGQLRYHLEKCLLLPSKKIFVIEFPYLENV